MLLLASCWAALAVVATPTPTPAVVGATICPSADEVAARLRSMLSAGAPLPSDGFVELADVPARVAGLVDIEVRLRRGGDPTPLSTRLVERSGGCSETADAVAVIAASWAGRYATPSLPPLPEAASPLRAASVARSVPAPSAPLARFSLGAAAGVVGAVSGTGAVAPLVGLDVEAVRGAWVVGLMGAGMGERTVTVGSGSAAWRQLVLLPRVARRWGSSRAFVELGAGAGVGVTETKGMGFAANASDVGIDLGVAPGFRLGGRLAAFPAIVWVGVTTVVWLRPHRVSVEGSVRGQELPRFDAWAGGGLAFPFDSNI